ncbi:MAG: hypothetical protein QM775_33935 [Pirellulales bacterium]
MNFTRIALLAAFVVAVTFAEAPNAHSAEPARTQLAFPGAEGFGRHSLGGRGGRAIFVTNLDDYNPKTKKTPPIEGSFRWALAQPGPRTIVFRTSGVIKLVAPLKITEPRVTIAGQTAPGDGICLTDYGTQIEADDVVLRHVRFRPGDAVGKEAERAGRVPMSQRHHRPLLGIVERRRDLERHRRRLRRRDRAVVLHHGEPRPKRACQRQTRLRLAHPNRRRRDLSPQSLRSSSHARCPRPGTYGKPPGLLLDFRHNVIYDWISPAGYTSDDPARINYVGNYLKPGPSTTERAYMFNIGGPATQIYAADNLLDFERMRTAGDWAWIEHAEPGNKLAAALEAAPVAFENAETVCDRVPAEAGATRPKRDAIDLRIVEQFRTSGGRVINAPSEVGGLPTYTPTEPPADSDADGIPDAWETAHQLNPQDPADAAADRNSDGFTNLEEWLNELAA